MIESSLKSQDKYFLSDKDTNTLVSIVNKYKYLIEPRVALACACIYEKDESIQVIRYHCEDIYACNI